MTFNLSVFLLKRVDCLGVLLFYVFVFLTFFIVPLTSIVVFLRERREVDQSNKRVQSLITLPRVIQVDRYGFGRRYCSIRSKYISTYLKE